MVERPPLVLDFGAFAQPPSPLFRDYLRGGAGVAPFYEGARFDLGTIAAAADRAAAHPRERRPVAEALAEQQRRRGAEAAERQALRLADPRAAAVVTGQQAVLFGGPLYVLYKAVAAMKVAALLEAKRGAPVVPVFWVASDDHDFAEIRQATLLGPEGRLRTLRYAPEVEPVGQPAARIVLDATIDALLDELAECLPASLHRDHCVLRVRAAYRPGESVAGAFARLLSDLLPGLVVMDPSDRALKALMRPVLEREVREASPTSRLAAAVGPALLAAGYHQQVPVRDGFLNLFGYVDGERRALGLRDGRVEVRGTSRLLPVEEVLSRIAREPELFSPGVLLRPLAQDLLLPTAAYVGGPAEIAYHAQIGPSYAHFGLARPVLMPRPSLALVEPAQARALDAEGLSLQDLEGDPEALLTRWARAAYPEVETAFADARESVARELLAIEERLGALDPTLRAAADSARGRALHQIDTLHEKATRALKKRDQSRAERLRRTRDALFPGGALQERGLGLVGPLARHGQPLVEQVHERMDPWAQGHQVVFL
jgi:bacillithiol biosynthesis cysteine-adding enzyme BshC